MIIARLQGGLGNQLFQYAAAKALAIKLHTPFRLDAITALKKDKLRQIALHQFEAKFQLATKKEIRQFIPFPALYRHKPGLFAMLGKNIYQEPHFHFDKNFLLLSDPVFIDGFWQSPLYFDHIKTIIRQDFSIKPELIRQVKEKGAELENNLSVAVHIRRGDFLNAKAAAYHGVLDASYYQNAIALLQQKSPDASFHIFSDDMEWVKQNMNMPANAEFISSPTQSAIEDFYLMTKCRHNIIANSSFSWWSAWLNNNQKKIVIAPKQWFNKARHNTTDLFPSDWITV